MANKSLARALTDGLGFGRKSTFSLSDGAAWRDFFGLSNMSGQRVTVDRALQLSTVWACVRLISETLSTLPMHLYRDEANGTTTIARDHDLYPLLHHQPNFYMTATTFWQAFITSLLVWGNAYVHLRRTNVNMRKVITSFEILLPDRVTRQVMRDGSIEWSYIDQTNGTSRTIADDEMWHTPAFTLDGYTGLSPITMGANVIGGAMAADEASANTFRRGMKATGLVTMDMALTPVQREATRSHVQTVADAGGYFVLEKGTGFQQLNMTPQDAQLLSTRAFNVEEICRWFRVPPFLVGHSEKSTTWGTGIEQQNIGFVQTVLRPWAVRIEQSITKNLLRPEERSRYGAEFVLEGLLRGDSAARAAFYSTMANNGLMCRDECRRLENLPEMGGNAAVLTVQSALVPIDMLGQQPATAPAPPQEETTP